jgi:hypothetical protein
MNNKSWNSTITRVILIVSFLQLQTFGGESGAEILLEHVKKQNPQIVPLTEKQACEILPTLQYDPVLIDYSYGKIANNAANDYEFAQTSKYIFLHEGNNKRFSKVLFNDLDSKSDLKQYYVIKFMDDEFFNENFGFILNAALNDFSDENLAAFLTKSLVACPAKLGEKKNVDLLNVKWLKIKSSVNALNNQFAGDFAIPGLSNHPLVRVDKLMNQILTSTPAIKEKSKSEDGQTHNVKLESPQSSKADVDTINSQRHHEVMEGKSRFAGAGNTYGMIAFALIVLSVCYWIKIKWLNQKK